MKPIIQSKIRVATLTSGEQYGSMQLDDNHMMDRLNGFVRNLDNPTIETKFKNQLASEYPDLSIGAKRNEDYLSDYNLKDTHRIHMGIEEKFRKKRLPVSEYRKIADPATRLHIAMSRGLERNIISSINLFDNEIQNQKSIRPNIDNGK